MTYATGPPGPPGPPGRPGDGGRGGLSHKIVPGAVSFPDREAMLKVWLLGLAYLTPLDFVICINFQNIGRCILKIYSVCSRK